jgi:hypothetical protein
MQPLGEGTYGMVVNAEAAGHSGCKLVAKVARLTVETTAEDLRRLVAEAILSRKMLDHDSTFRGHCLWVTLKKDGCSLLLVTIHERAWMNAAQFFAAISITASSRWRAVLVRRA